MSFPSETLRKSLEARSKRAMEKKKEASPSERKSASLKKKLARGTPIVELLKDDCRDCPKYPCGKNLQDCEEKSVVDRCNQCGLKVRFRFVFGEPYYCPICIGRRKK